MRARGLVGALGAAMSMLLVVAPTSLASAAAQAVGSPRATAARVGSTPGARQLQLVLPLQADTAGLRRLALAVTTPGSPEFGHYRSIASLSRQFGALASVRRRVVSYLRRIGATAIRLDATGLFADATITAGTAERLFATSLAEYKTTRGAPFTAPTGSMALPAPLRGLVTGVVGLDTRPVLSPPQRFHRARAIARAAVQITSGYFPASGTARGCSGALGTGSFTPNQYLTAYGYDSLHAGNVTGQGERVALIEIDGFKHSDISTFAKCFGLRLPAINSFGVFGLRKSLRPGGESTLDLEVLDAAAPGLKAIDVYESSANEASALKALTSPLQNSGFKPQVISASLGLCEQFVQQAVGNGGISAAESALQEAAASGISFLDSSGDSGSADCLNGGVPQHRIAVNYPASSPWVTGVGGTNLFLNSNNTIHDQVVWNDTDFQPGSAGGGGPSRLFHRPRYQTGTVGSTWRQVPDVSLLADVAPGYAIFCSARTDCINSQNSNAWQGVGGTSAATPLLAGGFALVDQELRQHQRQDLGLANPLLYQIGRAPALRGSVFSDVVVIGNDVGPFIGNHQPLGCCTAVAGYDNASGWGSVNLATFAQVALADQPKIVSISLAVPAGQRPVAAKHINATVSCTGVCVLGAFAVVQIGHAKQFQVFSNVYVLKSRGRKSVKISFSRNQLGKLRAGLSSHARIRAAVVGAIVDAGGNIEKRSRTKVLTITG